MTRATGRTTLGIGAELEVETLVVDGPATVGLHVDGVIHVEDFVEGLRAETDDTGQLKYQVADGIFKLICNNSNAKLITGVICGYRVEEIENPLTQKVRYLDKLVDELAKGRKMEKILRT